MHLSGRLERLGLGKDEVLEMELQRGCRNQEGNKLETCRSPTQEGQA